MSKKSIEQGKGRKVISYTEVSTLNGAADIIVSDLVERKQAKALVRIMRAEKLACMEAVNAKKAEKVVGLANMAIWDALEEEYMGEEIDPEMVIDHLFEIEEIGRRKKSEKVRVISPRRIIL